MFKRGSRGQMVKMIQKALGFASADGIFGEQTLQAVKEFQQANGLPPDGIVDVKTLTAMGINIFENSFQTFRLKLTANKIRDASMDDIPKLVEAITPMFRNNDNVKQHLHEGLALGMTFSEEFHLHTPEYLAHFFGQIREEVGTKFITTENFNYKCEALPKLFSYYRKHPEEAQQHGRCEGHKANWEAIANRAYAHRIGNAGISSGDGWKYRGRGSKQLTGKANYQSFQDYMDQHFSDISKDFMQQPDLLEQPGYALLSGAIFWEQNKLYKAAENGLNESASNAVTAIVNKHTQSYTNRWKHTQKAAHLLGLA